MKIRDEIRGLKREEGMEPMLRISYETLANGGRNLRERIARKRVDPDQAEAIRRALGMK